MREVQEPSSNSRDLRFRVGFGGRQCAVKRAVKRILDPAARDTTLLRFFIFATFFELDPRFGSHHRYKLYIPLLSDAMQLKHKPAIISEIVNDRPRPKTPNKRVGTLFYLISVFV